jgi:hypothetical protein
MSISVIVKPLHLLAPFRHRVELGVMPKPDGLTLESMLFAGPDKAAPVTEKTGGLK